MTEATLFNLDPAFFFQISTLFVMPFWFVMAFLPRWKPIVRAIRSPWIAIVPAIFYVILVLPGVVDVIIAVSMPDINALAAILGTPLGTAISWMHFLAFDLFVGRWIYLDAIDRHIHPIIITPILFFTLMLGPVGYILYMIVHQINIMRKSTSA
ncbi:MAG: ABA4-like family protein [Chloroflexota bacterium]